MGRASVHAAGGAVRLGHQCRPHAGRPARGSRPPARPAAALDRGGAQGGRCATSISCGRRSSGWPRCCRTDGRYLLGGEPCIADFAAYHVIWFFKGRHIDCRAELAALPAPAGVARPHGRDRPRPAHRDRSRRGAGRGPRRRAAPRRTVASAGRRSPARRAGPRAAADNARDWIEGEVSFVDTHEIALLRHDPDVGRVAVHFPRLGYDWRRAR